MENRQIAQLPQATVVNNDDLFVLQQSAIAKKLSGSTLKDYLNESLGIASIQYVSTTSDGVKYRITYNNGHTFDYVVPYASSAVISINGSTGAVTLDGSTIPVSPTNPSSISQELSYIYDVANGKTGSDINVSSSDTTKIATKFGAIESSISGLTGSDIPVSSSDSTKIANKISALNTSITTLTGNSIAVSSSDSTKLNTKIANMDTAIGKCEMLVLTTASFSSLPYTLSNSNIENDMVCVHAELSNPSMQTDDWTVTTSAGSVKIEGSRKSGESTTVKLYLIKSR